VSLEGIFVAVDMIVAGASETKEFFTNDDEEVITRLAARRCAIMDSLSEGFMVKN
jgi:hypothetical protein